MEQQRGQRPGARAVHLYRCAFCSCRFVIKNETPNRLIKPTSRVKCIPKSDICMKDKFCKSSERFEKSTAERWQSWWCRRSWSIRQLRDGSLSNKDGRWFWSKHHRDAVRYPRPPDSHTTINQCKSLNIISASTPSSAFVLIVCWPAKVPWLNLFLTSFFHGNIF